MGGYMNNLYLVSCLVLVLFVSGCSTSQSSQLRTGTIFITKFSIDPATNNNPAQINNDAVENIRSALEHNILKYIKDDTKMTPVSSGCPNSDYELRGKITSLNMTLDHHFRVIMITHSNDFLIDIEGSLFDCRNNTAVVNFNHDKEKSNMMDAIEKVAEKTVGDIEYIGQH